MIASTLISDIIPALKPTDTVQKALTKMIDFRVSHLPIVDKSHFIGTVSEDNLIEVIDMETMVSAVPLSLISPYILEDQHVYDAVRAFDAQKLTLLAVLDNKMNYLGAITLSDLTSYFAKITAIADPGGIIVLEISTRDNSMAHIAQIVESDNAQILSSYVDAHNDSTKLTITIKVNKLDVTQIVASFLRYEYVVVAIFNNTDHKSAEADRYDSLMKYLSF